MIRIPNASSPVEIRKAFQQMKLAAGFLLDGTLGQILIGAGANIVPTWGTDLTALTLLTVDNISINGAVISSDTGAISFSNENITTTGTVAGINVTSGENPGHTHTGTSLSGIDISVDTNLSVTSPITLTDDDVGLDQSAIDHGSISGLSGDDHTQYHNNTRGDARYYTQTLLDGGQLDGQYFQESEFLNSSAGAGDSSKPVKLDANGHIDATMLNDADVDHGTIGGLEGDDHTQYSLADGTRDFSGVIVGVDPTASNHLATKEYVDSSISFIEEFFFTNAASGIDGYFNMVDQHTGEDESSDSTEDIIQDTGQPLTEWITIVGVPGVIDLEHGIYSVHINVEKTGSGARDVRIYFEVWTRTHPGGVEALRVISEISDLITSRASIDLHASLAADVIINETDRVVIKFFANGVSGGNDATITLYKEGTTSSHFGLPISSEVLSTIFLRQDGTKALAGNMLVDAGITIDGRDISADGILLDAIAGGKVAVDTNATPDFLGNAFNDGALRTSTGISFADGGDFITLTTNDGEIAHDSLSGYDANKHIDHTGVSVSPGSGMTGGGDISTTRTLTLNIIGLDATAIAAGDSIPFWDITATATNKRILFSSFEAALTHDNLIAGTIADHDTTATGANLTSLTDDSMVDALHRHSELSASDGTPNSALSIDAAGALTVTGAATFDSTVVSTGLLTASAKVKTAAIYPASDSTTAIQIQKADATTPVLTVDTTNGRVGIGQPPGNFLLEIYRAGSADMAIGGPETEVKGMTLVDITSGERWVWSHRTHADGNKIYLSYYNGAAWSEPMVVLPDGSAGHGSLSPDARLEVETGAAEGKQAITIDQNDIDQAFIDFQGESEAGAAKNISSWTAGCTIQGFVLQEVNGSPFWMPYYDAPTGTTEDINVDHSGVSISAGSGLTGGGDITTTRTLALDINGLSVATIVAGDFIPFWDITATATNKKTTFTNFEAALSHDNLIAGTIADHDTTATGTNLTTLTDNSNAVGLHWHSRLEASDGSPTPALYADTAGRIAIGTWGTLGNIFNVKTTNGWWKIYNYGHTKMHNENSSQWWGFCPRDSGVLDIAVQGTDPAGGTMSSSEAVITFSSSKEVCIGAATFASRFEVQTGASEGRQAVTIDQNDADEAFIDFQGTSAASAANNISTWTNATVKGFALMEFNGVSGWVAFYNPPTS